MRGATVTVQQLRARCVVDLATHCWHWQGGKSKGRPVLYTIDYATGTKGRMAGTRGAWNIAHGAAPLASQIVYRVCGCSDCMNPVHLRLAASRIEFLALSALSGRLKGRHYEGRAQSLRKAWAAGRGVTPPEKVALIRDAHKSVTNTALAALLGIHHSTVSLIRRGDSHRQVSAPVVAPVVVAAADVVPSAYAARG